MLAPGESSKPAICAVTMSNDDVTNAVTATGDERRPGRADQW
jgi:hypothetical protein